MKPSFLSALFFLGATALCAQSDFSILPDLEGTWYQQGRQRATYSTWQATGDRSWENRVFSVYCGDTTLLSHAVLHTESGAATLTLWTDSLPNGAAQVFRLLQADADVLVFQNEDPQARPRQLAWQFYDRGLLQMRTDAIASDFRRRHCFELHADLGLRLGVNMSTLGGSTYLLDQRYTRAGLGTDLALSMVLHGKGPLGFNFELGMSQRQMVVSAAWRSGDVNYVRYGTYRNVDFYGAFLPEIGLGKKRQLLLSAGIMTTFARINAFRGSTTARGANPDPHEMQPASYLGREEAVLAGFSWQLPARIFPGWKPALYGRGTWGMGYAKVRALSLGLRLQLKPD